MGVWAGFGCSRDASSQSSSEGENYMSHRRQKRARQAARLAITTVVSSGALVLTPTLQAQETSQSAPAGGETSKDTLQEVVVTGFRASLQNALQAKRDSDLPIESVAAEDLG